MPHKRWQLLLRHIGVLSLFTKRYHARVGTFLSEQINTSNWRNWQAAFRLNDCGQKIGFSSNT